MVAFLFSFLLSISALAQICECTVDVGNQNRRIWGSWALECAGHGGHGDCPTSNIDTVHSAGQGAMTGDLYVYARHNGAVKASWKRSFPDDHISAFKGPIWTSDGWEWTNVCSCDGYRQTNSCGGSPRSQWWDPYIPMFAGAQEDPEYVFQGRSSRLRFPYECGNSAQQITVHESIRENDPFSPDDPMGTIAVGAPALAGVYDYTQWVEHFEPAYNSSGGRTHAGYAGGSYGAEIVLRVSCNNIPKSGDTVAPELLVTSVTNGQTVNQPSILLAGTATDYRFGGNGISSVTINGVRASGDSASGSNTANWSQNVNLNEGTNTFTLVARDNSTYKNARTVTVSINYAPDRGPANEDPPPPPPAPNLSRLDPGQQLLPGQSLVSTNGQHILAYQGDGNLVIYSYGYPTWASNTFGAPGFAPMQGDGNFVIYAAGGIPVWASNTAGYYGSYLVLQDDGNLVVYSVSGQPLWWAL